MKATVDATKCSGYGTCAEICPSVFSLDDWGYAAVVGDGTVPDKEIDKATEAASSCPENAIVVQD